MEASFFESVTASASTKNLYDMLAEIQSGRHATKISTLRECNDEEVKEKIKRTLPSFTPSGVFSKSHKKDDLQSYNPLIVLDIDKVGSGKANELKQKVSKMDTTFAAFISPSGNGLKILVKCDSTAETHEKVFQQLADHYESILGIKIDRSGKDFSRLCFMSYDPEIYLNDQSLPFHLTSHTEVPRFSTRNVSVTTPDIFQMAVEYTESKLQFIKGYRNAYLYLLANNLNRLGAGQTEALAFINSHYTDPDMVNEIYGLVRRAYSNTSDHGKYSPDYVSTASSVSSASFATTATALPDFNTPIIPTSVYQNLPVFLRKATEAFKKDREMDMFLTGALTVLSGCFNNVYGLYFGDVVHPNLYSFIIAPPASGKHVLGYNRNLGQKIHERIRDSFQQIIVSENPSKAPSKFFIPADSSAAAFKRTLVANDGKGIIFETEADTLTNTFAQDWGGFKDATCKAFHHEPISFDRIGIPGENNYGEIKKPKLSIVLSGTPIQVPTLIHGIGDGLFSRFIMYTFINNQIPTFNDPFDRSGIQNLEKYFEALSVELLSMFHQVNEFQDIEVRLQDHQEKEFRSLFDATVKRIYFRFGSDTESIVKRLGLITFRFAMILTILRSIENNTLSSTIICDDVDFETAITLSDVYLEHSLNVFQTLPATGKSVSRSAQMLFENLPDKFSCSEAVEIGKNVCTISERSVSNYLNELRKVGKLLQPKNNGPYIKPTLQ